MIVRYNCVDLVGGVKSYTRAIIVNNLWLKDFRRALVTKNFFVETMVSFVVSIAIK